MSHAEVEIACEIADVWKKRALEMTKEIEGAMERDLKDLPWMTPATKTQALEKLHAIVNKIGYPDKWRDYSSIRLDRNDFLGNVDRAAIFESHRVIAKIGKPVDRGEWQMTPPTVNAYFDGQMNDIGQPVTTFSAISFAAASRWQSAQWRVPDLLRSRATARQLRRV